MSEISLWKRPIHVRALALLVFLFLVSFLLLMREARRLPDGNVHMYTLDVGQGDSILLVSPSGAQIIVDGGVDASLLTHLGTLMPLGDRTIELLILTHPNLDHIAAFPDVLERYHVKRVLLTGVPYKLSHYSAMMETIRRKQIPVLLPDPNQDIVFADGLKLDVVWPPKDAATRKWKDSTVNDSSMVLRAVFGEESLLLTGDIEEVTENEILATGANVQATVLKVAHHGSKTSSSTGFLLAVDPEIAVVSVGAHNSYGHPSPSVVERYRFLGIPLYRTSTEGTIHVVLDGKASTPVMP